MKNHTIKTPTAELLVVELPIGWDYEPITELEKIESIIQKIENETERD